MQRVEENIQTWQGGKQRTPQGRVGGLVTPGGRMWGKYRDPDWKSQKQAEGNRKKREATRREDEKREKRKVEFK